MCGGMDALGGWDRLACWRRATVYLTVIISSGIAGRLSAKH